jgi:cellulose biosynthesis protein BcsQ
VARQAGAQTWLVHTRSFEEPLITLPSCRCSIPPCSDFLINEFSFDPAKLIATSRQPILIVQGERDIQVGVSDAELLAHATEGFTVSIIDTPAGTDHAPTAAAICAADLCLVPIGPSVADVEAVHPTLKIIRQFERPIAFVLNQTAARYEPTGAAAPLHRVGVLALPFIVLRNDHQNALGAGLGVSEFASNGKAAGEIREFWTWVKRHLNIQPADNDRDLVA